MLLRAVILLSTFPIPNFQKGGDLTGPQLLERVAGEEGDDFSGGWVGRLQFSHKN